MGHELLVFFLAYIPKSVIDELVPKSVILSPALAVSQAKALRNRIFQGCSSKI
jgi:hypothetical protein